MIYYDMVGRPISESIWAHFIKNVKESHVCDYNISTTYIGTSRDAIYQTLVTCPTQHDKYNGYVEVHAVGEDPIQKHKRIHDMLEEYMVANCGR